MKKKTKKAAKHLDNLEAVAKKHKKKDKIFNARQEARIDTLLGLKQMAEQGIVIDAAALQEMIDETQGATTPVEEISEDPVIIPNISLDEVARQIGISSSMLRKYLRELFPDKAPGKGGTWLVTASMVEKVIAKNNEEK
jgi:hypothetical protein